MQSLYFYTTRACTPEETVHEDCSQWSLHVEYSRLDLKNERGESDESWNLHQYNIRYDKPTVTSNYTTEITQTQFNTANRKTV